LVVTPPGNPGSATTLERGLNGHRFLQDIRSREAS